MSVKPEPETNATLINSASIVAAIDVADQKINAKLGYQSNSLAGWYSTLTKTGSVEVGWRECCGSTHITMIIRREWVKVTKKMERAGMRLLVERVKHGNAYATNNGGFWQSEIFKLSPGVNPKPETTMTLSERIDSLETRKAVLEKKLGIADPMATHFPLGAGCGNAGTRKKQYAAADRLIDDSVELQKVKTDLAFFIARQKAVEAGECYENGQRCATAPSRVKAQNLSDLYGDYLRATCPPGTKVELMCNGSTHTVKRIGKKAVHLEGGDADDPWEFFDIRPLRPDGTNMTPPDLAQAIKAWKATQPVAA